MSKIGAKIDPVGQTIADKTGSGAKVLDPLHIYARSGEEGSKGYEADQLKKQLAAQSAANAPVARAKDMETREAFLLQQAQAGGATKTENEADLLGYTPGTKRKTASRTLLG